MSLKCDARKLKHAPLLLAALASLAAAQAPSADPVKWSLRLDPARATPGSAVHAWMRAAIEPGWHMYSLSTAGAVPTTIQILPNPVVESVRVLQPRPHRAFDANFNAQTETFENAAEFLLVIQLRKDAGAVPITVEARYQTCNDKVCIPPVRRTATATLTLEPGAPAAVPAVPPGYEEPQPPAPPAAASPHGAGFLLVAFGFGLAAIFTPCVFPMIPITMSYFLNRPAGGRGEGVAQAAVFSLGIVVLFSALGLAATAALGPFGVVQLGSSPWVNGFIAALFVAFALSLLGAFEITIPSSVLTRLDRSSRRGGYLGSLLMGLTFSLASFACVGPFVGTLLAASVGGGGARPLAGMAAFATGLALPFFLLALFPSYLNRLPRSGGWMARVKVVLGFLILAASLKYLSGVDQVMQWGLLTRERFLAAWIVIFAMAGLYLLGLLRLEGVKADENVGPLRLLLGMGLVAFALSLAPGMAGGRLGELDAYVPLAPRAGPAWMKDQLREALDRAKREGKLVFVNFTGYACTNCHWMKANMFPRPEIAAALGDFVLLELYTDGPGEASRANQEFQLKKFRTIAIPFYALLDADQNVVATFPGLTKDAAQFLSFLRRRPAVDAPLAGLTTLDGAPFDTSSLAGKTVVANFWATWCVPCVQEIPGFNKLSRELAGVAFVGISMDDDGAPAVRAFLKKHPIEYPVAMGAETLATRYEVDVLPVTIVFGPGGKQVKRFEGFTAEKDLAAAIAAIQ